MASVIPVTPRRASSVPTSERHGQPSDPQAARRAASAPDSTPRPAPGPEGVQPGVAERQAYPRQGGRVQRPLVAAAVLDPDRPVGHRAEELVEGRGVERADHRLVVPDEPHPLAGPGPGCGGPQHLSQPGSVGHRRGPALDRTAAGGQGQEVQVVVVEAGQERPASPVDLDPAAGCRRPSL